ncbi:MAG: sigma 54-interacting transcriptional regulator [Deltaproteobacteria bacterium]|nr:sigma 54-interacting transcriptional regulator [Deltaproteobacteria bacterium]
MDEHVREMIGNIPLDDLMTDTSAWRAVELAFATLGRAVLLLDEDFKVLVATQSLSEMLCDRAAEKIVGRPISNLLGESFAAIGSEIRTALEQGMTQEGRRAFLHCGEGQSRLASVSGSLLPGTPPRYLLVIRPAESEILSSVSVGRGLVAESPAMLSVVHLIEQLHRSEANLLVTGESGVGKEAVARAFHESSPRRGGPFVAINCAAIPETLLESELFGHKRGAFTGAVRDRKGRFEMASGGTLFLDEIGELPLHLQAKLLRVLQDKTFLPVGEDRVRKLDARIMAATNVDIEAAIARGDFREDLYYRLSVVPVRIPPLRDRPEDIEPLTRHLLMRISGREGRALLLSPDALDIIRRYRWPGNVRQLQNVIEFAVAMSQGQTLRPDHLPTEIRQERCSTPRPEGEAAAELPVAATDPERARIEAALSEAHWNRNRAAERLGISRTTLWRRMRELGIQ